MAEGGHGRRKKAAPALTLENITSALKGIEREWDHFGEWLYVPDETRSGIRSAHSNDFKKLQQVILYILAVHPLASWKVIILALQRMGKHQLAESIQEYAEPVTDPSLNVTNLVEVINMMKKKWDVDYTTSLASISLANQHEREWYNDFRYSLADHLDVPRSKQEEIRRQHQSVNASFSRYCVSSLPGFSWARLAGALYCSEEESALVAAKRYIKREEDPTLTLDNLLTVLEKVTDWKELRYLLDVPKSRRVVMTEKESMLREWLDNHPAPSWELLAWALYRSGGGRPTEHSVLKHLYGRYVTAPSEVWRKINACQQAIAEKGAIEQTTMQGVFIGYPRSGKTTSKKRLVSKKAGVNQASTGVAEKVTRVEIEKSTVYSSWKEITELNDETAIVVEEVVDHISNKVEEDPVQLDVSHIRDEDTKSLPKGQNPNRIRAIVRKVKTMFSRKKPNSSIESTENEAKTPKGVSNTLQILSTSLQLASKSTPLHQQRERQWTLYLSDVGGQTEFQEMLPSLVSGPSLYFLTFPLHKGLNERFRVEYQHPTNGNIVPIESTSSNKEVLLQSLSSITSTRSYTKALDGKSVSPKVLLIGTHRDQIQSEQQLMEIDKQLQDIIKKTAAFKENMIVFCSESQMVFAVDNTSDDDADIQQVRDAVERLAVSTDDYRIQTPYTWMIFAATLRHLPERVLSIEKCLEVAKECGIDTKDELNNALWFLHHNVGIIRHFQDHRELQNVVIKEPQYIFDKVTELIIKTFTFRNVGPHLHDEFIKKGIFPTDMVHKLSTDSDTLTGDKFAILLEHHHIIAPIEEDGKVVKYFAPAALAHAELPPNAESKDIIPPLLVVFESGYCPKGMFGALVVNLLKNGKFELKEDRIYRDQICLSVSPHYDSFQFSLSPISIKIALHTTIEQNRKITLGRICCDVRREIDESIRAVTEVLHYTDKAAHSFAFSCPEPPPHDESHAATINFSPEGEPCTLTCPFSGNNHLPPDGHMLWFDETCLPPKAETISSTSDINGQCVMDAEASDVLQITVNPQVQPLKYYGQKVVLIVRATGASCYLWLKDGEKIPSTLPNYTGAKTNKLEFTFLTPSHSGSYKCQVSNSNGQEMSDSAKFEVVSQMKLKDYKEAFEGGCVTVDKSIEGKICNYLEQEKCTLDEDANNMEHIVQDILDGATINTDDAIIDFTCSEDRVLRDQSVGNIETKTNPTSDDEYQDFEEDLTTTKGSETWSSETRGWSLGGGVNVGYQGYAGASTTLTYSSVNTTTSKTNESEAIRKPYKKKIFVPKGTKVNVDLKKKQTEYRYKVSGVKVTMSFKKKKITKIITSVKKIKTNKKEIKVCNVFDNNTTVTMDGEYVWSEITTYVNDSDFVSL